MINLRCNGIKVFSLIKGNFSCIPKSYNDLSTKSFLRENFGFLSFHTSSERFKFGPAKPITQYKKPVNWLPFEWHRKPRLNLYEESGDLVKENIVDPSLPKPDFELSDELKTADETVKNIFSVATASKREAQEVLKRNILKRIQRHPFDFDSLEVRIALMTIRVRALFEHYRTSHKREVRVSRIVLPIMIQKRNSLLKQLRKIDEARFKWVLEELQLYYNPPVLGVKNEFYCKKWDLRRLTKKHIQEVIAEKKAVYHEELKAQQQEFLEEKKKILAWIEEEEKALKAETTNS